MTAAAQTGTTVAVSIMSGVTTFLAFRLYETREVAVLLTAANQPAEEVR